MYLYPEAVSGWCGSKFLTVRTLTWLKRAELQCTELREQLFAIGGSFCCGLLAPTLIAESFPNDIPLLSFVGQFPGRYTSRRPVRFIWFIVRLKEERTDERDLKLWWKRRRLDVDISDRIPCRCHRKWCENFSCVVDTLATRLSDYP